MAEVNAIDIPVNVAFGQTLKNGDKLLINLGNRASEEEVDNLQFWLSQQLDGITVIVFRAENMIIYRGGNDNH